MGLPHAPAPHRRLRRHLPPRVEDDEELRELQEQLAIETVKRQARAGPMADAIRDLLSSSPEAMEVLKPFLPGYRPVSVVSGQLSVAEDLGVPGEPLPRGP